MTSYSFYETTKAGYYKTIPGLLFKIFETTGKSLMLLTTNEEETRNFDNSLWSFSSDKFLPHGTLKDSPEHYAPLLISEILENNNNAEILVSTRPIPSDFADNFRKVIFIYQNDCEDKDFYQDIFSKEKNNKGTKFWKQDNRGKWEMLNQAG